MKKQSRLVILTALTAAGLAYFTASLWLQRTGTVPSERGDMTAEYRLPDPGSSERQPSGQDTNDRKRVDGQPKRQPATSSQMIEATPYQHQSDAAETKLNELKQGINDHPDDSPIVVPESPQDREHIIALAIEGQGIELVNAVVARAREEALKRVPNDIAAGRRQELDVAMRAMEDSEFSYALEFREAIKEELRSADLARPPARRQGANGLPGSVTVVVQRAQDERPVRLVAHYFVSFDKYERLNAARRARIQAKGQ